MSVTTLTSKPLELFLRSWHVYQEIIAYNYMYHREISESARLALATFKAGEPLRVLDLGCGDASMALPLLEAGRIATYIGCDLSQPALDIARNQLNAQGTQHQLICAAMLQAAEEQPDVSVDIVFSSYALHHLNAINKRQIIKAINRILAPGGYFVLIDIFREPAEDRPTYIRNYINAVHEQWNLLSPESQNLVINHAKEYDFPEFSSFYETECTHNRFASRQRLSKHTWHESWLFAKTL